MKGKRKNRTRLGKWLDRNGIEQQELEEAANISRNTISRLCNNSQHTPSFKVVQKIMKAIKRVDSKAKITDFWDIDIRGGAIVVCSSFIYVRKSNVLT